MRKIEKYEITCKECGSIREYSCYASYHSGKKQCLCKDCAKRKHKLEHVTFKEKWKRELSEDEYNKKMAEFKEKQRLGSDGKNNPMYGKTIFERWVEKYGVEEAERRRESHRINSTNGNAKPMTGRSVYSVWVEKYGVEEADRKMEDAKKKWSLASKGKNNPMYGKKSPMGSGYGWKGEYKGWFFRSLRELCYMVNEIEKNNLKWENAEKRKYTIFYEIDGVSRTYRADFVINGKRMVEIKPKKLHTTKIAMAKKEAAEKFCLENNMQYELVDCELDTDKIFDLYKKGEIIFKGRYKEKIDEYFTKRKEGSGA